MKVVLDANVIIAAFATRGLCQAVLEYCLDNHHIVLSEPLLIEITRNLHKKLKVPLDTVHEIGRYFRSHASFVEPVNVDASICKDQKDLMVLGTATAGEASYLVTGDHELLEVKQYASYRILAPREFWDKMRTIGD